MELFRIADIDSSKFRKVFRKGCSYAFIPFIVFVSIQIVIVLAYYWWEISFLFLLLVSVFCTVFVCKCLLRLFKNLTSSSWLLAISETAVYINFRSCLYEKYSNDNEQVIKFRASEIKAFRQVKITDVICVGRSTSTQQKFYLDIIVSGELAILQKALSNEHFSYGLGKNRRSKIEVSTLEFPVIVSQENIVRVEVTGINSHNKTVIVAELKSLGIEEFEKYNKVYDFKKMNSTDDGVVQRIVELLSSGRRLDARNVIQYVFKITRKETNKMIEELVQKHVLK